LCASEIALLQASLSPLQDLHNVLGMKCLPEVNTDEITLARRSPKQTETSSVGALILVAATAARNLMQNAAVKREKRAEFAKKGQASRRKATPGRISRGLTLSRPTGILDG
jgi:hypothetical protein